MYWGFNTIFFTTIHSPTANLVNCGSDFYRAHILLLLYALFKCWTCSDPCWICKKIFATRCLAYDQPNELFFYINIFTLISYSPKPLCQMKLKKTLIFIGRSHKNIRIRKLYFDSAHNKTVQHKLYGAFTEYTYMNNKTTQVTCKVTN